MSTDGAVEVEISQLQPIDTTLRATSREVTVFDTHPFADESDPHVSILKPLRSVDIESMVKPDNDLFTRNREQKITNEQYNQELESEFAYLSETTSIEIDTSRCQVLQSIVDSMLEGKKGEMRIVIMNKGRNPNAFVTADGTIFISQSLLNVMDSLDEIAGVLGHEVNHYRYHTAQAIANSRHPLESMTLGWIHEMVADLQTKECMANAGFNPVACETAIQKLSAFERDFVHQTGLSRAMEMAAQRHVIDMAHSDKNIQPIPAELHVSEDPIPTNNELLHYLFARLDENPNPDDMARVIANLDKLHGRDLEEISNIFGKAYRYDKGHTQELSDIQIAFRDTLSRRLQSYGYKADAVTLFELAMKYSDRFQQAYRRKENARLIETAESFLHLIEEIHAYEDQDMTTGMYDKLFRTSRVPHITTPGSLLQMARYLDNVGVMEIYWQSRSVGAISMDPDQILHVIKGIQPGLSQSWRDVKKYGLSIDDFSAAEDLANHEMNRLWQDYGECVFIMNRRRRGQAVDQGDLLNYFQKAKDLGIRPKGFDYRDKYSVAIQDDDADKKMFLETLAQVFDLTLVQEVEKIPSLEEFTQKELIDTILNPQSDQYLDTVSFKRFFMTFHGEYRFQASEEERTKYLTELAQLIDELDLPIDEDIAVFLSNIHTDVPRDPSLAENEQNQRLLKYFLKMNLIMHIGTDYGAIPDAWINMTRQCMDKLQIDPSQLSLFQLINLSIAPLTIIKKTHYHSNEKHTIGMIYSQHMWGRSEEAHEDFEQIMELPFVKELVSRIESHTLEGDTCESALTSIQQYLNAVCESTHTGQFSDTKHMYSPELWGLIVGIPVRKKIQEVLEMGVKEDNYATLLKVLETYFPEDDTEVVGIIRKLRKNYLSDPTVQFSEKVEYLEKHFDEFGPDGMLELAEHIYTLPDYEYFQHRMGERIQEYLRTASVSTTIGSVGDYGSSFMTSHFGTVFESALTDMESRTETSTQLALQWFKFLHSEISPYNSSGYDHKLGRYIKFTGERTRFRSLHDVFLTLEDLPITSRYAITLKLLSESRGALSSPENKEELSALAQGAIDLEPGFIADAIDTSITQGNPKLIGLFLTRMLSPLLFRSLDTSLIDRAFIQAEYPRLSEEEIKEITTLPTKELIYWGAEYANIPDSIPARIAQDQYGEISQSLSTLQQYVSGFDRKDRTEETTSESQIDPAIEAVITGIEGSSALGVRSLQLGRQLCTFSPAVEKRLSRTLDRNPGLQKLFVWENITKWMKDDPEFGAFMRDQVIEVGDYLGGGSLFTTLQMKVKDNGESTKDAVIKILNPNAISIIRENYSEVKTLLDRLEKEHPKWKKEIGQSRLLTDLSFEWCLADINDPYFMIDDQDFRKVMTEYKGKYHLFAPEVVFNSMKVKSEEMVDGPTVNQLLEDDQVATEKKKEIVQELARFMLFQLNAPVVDAGQGEHYRLIHSDPHIGNYIVTSSDEGDAIGVIDRSMYLRLDEKDTRLMRSLIEEGDSKSFLNQFVERILEINQVGGLEKLKTKAKILGGIAKELATNSGSSVADRNLRLLQVALSQLPPGVKPPLNLLLMIKNITAMDSLLSAYGVSWKTI